MRSGTNSASPADAGGPGNNSEREDYAVRLDLGVVADEGGRAVYNGDPAFHETPVRASIDRAGRLLELYEVVNAKDIRSVVEGHSRDGPIGAGLLDSQRNHIGTKVLPFRGMRLQP